MDPDPVQLAAAAIADADALLIGAGAGMGVDSGLPDFRGDEGFWKAYPPFRGKAFAAISNPIWFDTDPTQAWGFFGHRLHLYRAALPHEGFQILKRWAETIPLGYFVFTSNVDGQFQKAGFAHDRILECHGSIHHMQCVKQCTNAIWPADGTDVEVDVQTIRATSALPRCRHCNGLARPNILMFGDGGWIADRSEDQNQRCRDWRSAVKGKKLVAIELGAGLAVPTVRFQCEYHVPTVIRINPREADVPSHGIAVPMGALRALREIAKHLPV